LGVFEAPSSLWEVVEGLAGVDDGQNRHRRRKRLAVWQNLTFGGSGELVQLVDGSGELLLESLELFHICFVSGKVQMKRRKVFQLEKRILME